MILSNGNDAQIAQRGIAGAEIVHRDAHAERAQAMRASASVVLVVVEQQRLGDLELEPRAAAGPASREDADRCSTRRLFLNCTGERLTATRTSLGQTAAALQASRSTHSPIGDDEPGFLGDRNELGGRDRAALGMVPAQQRLEAARRGSSLRPSERLVDQAQLAACERLAQALLEHAAMLQRVVHAPLEEVVGAAAFALGAIEREIGILHQRVGVVAVARARCAMPTAGADHDLVAVDVERLRHES